jgi:hypothetical protein
MLEPVKKRDFLFLFFFFFVFFFFLNRQPRDIFLFPYSIERSTCSFDFQLRIFPSHIFFSLDVFQKNAMICGAVTGAMVSAASNNNKDKIVVDAITGGAIVTAAEFLNYLT